MANEENEFQLFTNHLANEISKIGNGTVFLIIDRASKDKTLALAQLLSKSDSRFITIWAPENKCLADAYKRGYKEACAGNFEYIIEMDAGMSHNPASLSDFIIQLQTGYDCVFGSRFIPGGSMENANYKRLFLSKYGTLLSNFLLGTKLKDMTSGYQAFTKNIANNLMHVEYKAKAHFFQTEVKFLLRKTKFIEIPIQYTTPSPSVSNGSLWNSINCLIFYAARKIIGKKDFINP
jgi:dolichol-phosphate mannosyltransferase